MVRLVEKGGNGWRQKRERKLRELAPKFCAHGYKPVMERLVNRVRRSSDLSVKSVQPNIQRCKAHILYASRTLVAHETCPKARSIAHSGACVQSGSMKSV